MSSVIPPTIGRRVWFFPSEYDCGKWDEKPPAVIEHYGVQACDAGICYVHHDRLVNLTIADHTGKMHSRTSVQLVQPGDPTPTTGSYCTWMPYQTQQAVKS